MKKLCRHKDKRKGGKLLYFALSFDGPGQETIIHCVVFWNSRVLSRCSFLEWYNKKKFPMTNPNKF